MGTEVARNVRSTLTRQASERSADREYPSLDAHARTRRERLDTVARLVEGSKNARYVFKEDVPGMRQPRLSSVT